MVPHRLMAAVCAALVGVAPVAETPAPPAGSPAYLPCPIAPAALAVKTPQSTLPPPTARAANTPTVGGAGLATAGLTVATGAPQPPANLGARAWLVADLDTGEVLGSCGPHERHSPASVQKTLLAAALMGKLDPKQVVEVTAADLAIERGSSAVGLVPGGKYTIETLWLGLLLVSGNDAANVLARIGGGEAGVAGALRAMNELASRLGARDTNALTPHGLDAPGQFTSVYDLALIAQVCFASDEFRRYATTPNAQIPPQPPKDPDGFQIQNENQLISKYPGALGGKTGFTTASRHSYVGAAERNGRRLVVTLLHAEAVPQRGWQQGAALLDWGFSVPRGTSVGHLVQPGELDASPAGSGRATPGAEENAGEGDEPAGSHLLVVLLMLGCGLLAAAAAVVLAVRTRRSPNRQSRSHGRRRTGADRARRPDPGPDDRRDGGGRFTGTGRQPAPGAPAWSDGDPWSEPGTGTEPGRRRGYRAAPGEPRARSRPEWRGEPPLERRADPHPGRRPTLGPERHRGSRHAAPDRPGGAG